MGFLLALLPVWNVIRAIIGGVFTFLTTKPGVYVLAAGLAFGTIWYANDLGYHSGLKVARAEQELAVAQAQAEAHRLGMEAQRRMDANVIAAADAAGFARGKAQAHTVTITREVPKYVTVEIDRKFPVPCGLYRLLRAAQAGSGTDPASVSLPPGLSDGDACPLTASDLANNGIAVAGLYHEAEAQIGGLQDLARALKATIEGPSR